MLGMNPVDGGTIVVAEAPLSEMFKYATDLRSMTQARGSFTSEFIRYEDVPSNIAKKIIEAAKKEEEEERKRKEAKKGDDPDDKYSKLLEKLEALEKANAERDKKAARKATIESVKAGLKDKFDKANLEMKNYFLNAAIAKLEIPDEDVDIDDLVSKAEKIYTAEYKEATGENGIPAKGSRTSSGGTSTDDDKFMEEVAERRKKRFGGGDKK
jgi:hypothetical protein